MEPVLDLAGIGFGPSNLALAIAVEEHERPVRARFFERQARFGWHRGMLLEDATMQVSFLKDLVTLRNPTSAFSFLCYLRDRGRLVDFVNHKNLFPLRKEFHDYFEWAAEQVAHHVSYGAEVTGVRTHDDGFEITVGAQSVRTRNLVLATGLEANLPDGVEAGERVWHNKDLLTRIDSLRDPRHVVVVGAGQSAAETVAFFHDRFPAAEVHGVFARYGYSPADDSSFANRIFDPAAVDDFYSAPEEVKRRLMGYHANTNYGVVDQDLIEELYRRVYREKVVGQQRLLLHNTSRLTDVNPDGKCVIESLADGGQLPIDADVIVYATGYRPANPVRLLGDLADHCERDEHGRLKVTRDYRVVTNNEISGGIYLQGGTEHTHGITSSLLSNTAVRVGEILDSVLRRVQQHQAELKLQAVK
ncbi:lysine N(6)-hydroxylase/L-ornithine N(5)-oxygenase family protein [Lentzea sp. BCCO 10_0856]|uniref:L-lysine N6-monooxygenase MbtG n=1 Tax=Lentzea miocenica TaxID=3095431 RepID=A0ABU4SRM9_9PSEU|nr:lysine N(6)-hydroxylase/L-ornithine N(5)-oxygenase family protein [Lentzea sp. BCCO 10_0856]MDX8028576.1 lysine N(6)-hydroxylase/L-ornithine N(5)-oxygenase family protein [Lentzea sp. BCCO 10_0856]